MINGAITTTIAPTIRTVNHTVLLPVEIWLGGIKLNMNASNEPQKPRPPISHIRPLPFLPEGGDHNGDMGFVFCMRLIYRWTSQVVLGNLGIRNETPKKEVTAPSANCSGYYI